MSPVVQLDSVSHTFGDGASRKAVLRQVSLRVHSGELVILTGPSGSGKSTLLTLVGALRSVQQGSCHVLNHQLLHSSDDTRNVIRRQIGFIFQTHNLLPFLSARENIEMSAALSPDLPSPAQRRSRTLALLEAVGLTPEQDQLPATLSGGQRQRVAIARALAHQPRLILADEPTAALDRAAGHTAVELLRQLARERGTPILLVTHDARILDVADRILRFEDGRVVT